MSFLDLYMNKNPLITTSDDGAEPVATVFGVPFDATHSYKPGCRFGPDVIRDAFNNIEIFHPQFGIDLETANIEHLGNTTHTVSPAEMIEMVKKITTELVSRKRQLFILGGEHSITYGTYMSFPKNTGYVVFDAHYDLRDEYANTKYSHAAYLRRIVEERGSDNILHVGARAFVKEELEFLKENNIKTISDRQVREGQGPELLKNFASSYDSLYASFDLDVLDPAFAPGVSHHEPGGLTTRQVIEIIQNINVPVIGADIVELNPRRDLNNMTAMVAYKLLKELVSKMMD